MRLKSLLSIRPNRLLIRLLLVNMAGLVMMAGGVLMLSESREALVEAQRKNLLSQARLMAGALSDAASDRDYQVLPGSALFGALWGDRMTQNWRVIEAAEIMRRLSAGSRVRARLYGRNGSLLVDSSNLQMQGGLIARELPPPDVAPDHRFWDVWRTRLFDLLGVTQRPPISDQLAVRGASLQEVRVALSGQVGSVLRADPQGRDIVTVAVPVQAYRAIIGVLMVTSEPNEISHIIRAERANIFKLLGIALIANFFVSFVLARTLSQPISRLAGAVRGFPLGAGPLPREQTIPDLSARADEVGDLSIALRDMVRRLVDRMNAIDQFAADVAHELKNPLTSLHSAVQSLQNVKKVADRKALTAIIGHVVARLNGLVSVMWAVSRVEGGLAHVRPERFDLAALVVELGNILKVTRAEPAKVNLDVIAPVGAAPLWVRAQKDQIAQIIDNLIGNAISFSPPDGDVTLMVKDASASSDAIEVVVVDQGPGIAAGMEERIFERFYSDRPAPDVDRAQDHGHSGLGLSISRQIARMHGGEVRGTNREDGRGACFTLTLPKISGEVSGEASGAASKKALDTNGGLSRDA